MTDDELLAVPDGFGEAATDWWAANAPVSFQRGLLNVETRPDFVWMGHLEDRLLALWRRTQAEVGVDPAKIERERLLNVLSALSHRYALSPAGRAAWNARGRPTNPNPMPYEHLRPDEGGPE